MPLMSNDCLEYKVLILNRWGNLVKEVSKSDSRFDGKDSQGKNLTDGVYFYKIISKDIDCESDTYKPKCYGFITIVR
jgi:gliding motility-associated-like protein